MGGKRPDQYNIDPREAGSTDYKTLPQNGHGNSDLNETVQQDQQQLAQSQHDLAMEASGGSRGAPVPGARPAPSKDANRPLREGGDAMSASGGDHARDGDAQGTEDPRERGVGG